MKILFSSLFPTGLIAFILLLNSNGWPNHELSPVSGFVGNSFATLSSATRTEVTYMSSILSNSLLVPIVSLKSESIMSHQLSSVPFV